MLIYERVIHGNTKHKGITSTVFFNQDLRTWLDVLKRVSAELLLGGDFLCGVCLEISSNKHGDFMGKRDLKGIS